MKLFSFIKKLFRKEPVMGMPKCVHQIWIGGEDRMSPTVQACIASAKRWAAKHRIPYTLWTWEGLRKKFAGDACTDIFDKAMEVLPSARLFVLMSDYYRWALLAKHPGLYIDTDFYVHDTPKVPKADIVFMTPHRDGSPGNGMIWCDDPYPAAAGRLLVSFEIMTELRLRKPSNAFVFHLSQYLSRNLATEAIGPMMLNKVIIPYLENKGFTWAVASTKEVGCYGKVRGFLHKGEAAWKETF